jgi:hypothetical protein
VLLLTGWLLLLAPNGPQHAFHPEFPLKQWRKLESFPTGKACAARREQYVKDIDGHIHVFDAQLKPASAAEWLRCVSSDDPESNE